MNNRIGVTMMGPYGLKANNYRNAKFCTTVSSFQNTISPKRRLLVEKKGAKAFDFRTVDEGAFVIVDPRVFAAENALLDPVAAV